MIVSLNWLKQFTKINSSVEELVELIGARLVEVEKVINLSDKYKDIIIADVRRVEKHPDADKLHVVHIDDGGVAKDVARLDDGLVEVVCGAPNVREGMKVAWLLPGAIVPSTYGKDNFVLEARPLRGVVSNGMLASAKELGIGEDHAGIIEIDKDMTAGSSFAEAYELDDYLLDIENKSLTHRPDCFGLIGFAREVAAIQGERFVSPKWLLSTDIVLAPIAEDVEKLDIIAKVENAEMSARYQLVALEGVNAAKASPFSIQTWLARVGIRPISAVVDITNYLMYLTGQPLHAFDLDKVVAQHPERRAEIIVRESHEGEKLTLLDGRTITLANDDIIICAGEKPIGLAGAMGGETTEIDERTKRVLLESATFDLYRLRNTSMRHGIFSEAVTRFTKGQSAAQTAPVLASAVRLMTEVTGARRVSDIVDEFTLKPDPIRIEVSLSQINAALGSNFILEQAVNTILNIECEVTTAADEAISVSPPYWRGDMHIAEDVIEEVGRINGFDNIEPRLPLRSFKAVRPSTFDAVQGRVRQMLARAGANEVLTYNFVPERLLRMAQQNPEQAFKITNALSHDLQYYRLSLTPSLLEKTRINLKAGYDELALFELSKVHNKIHAEDDRGLPKEFPSLALVYAHQKPATHTGAAYFSARRFLDYLAARFNMELEYVPVEGDLGFSVAQPFEPNRSALVSVRGTDISLGIIGEFKESVVKQMKLPLYTAGFEVGLDEFAAAIPTASPYQPIGKYPGTQKDITLRVADEVAYEKIIREVSAVLAQETIEASFELLDIYQSAEGKDHKNVTLRLHLTNHEHTITTEEANAVVARVAVVAREAFGAEQV